MNSVRLIRTNQLNATFDFQKLESFYSVYYVGSDEELKWDDPLFDDLLRKEKGICSIRFLNRKAFYVLVKKDSDASEKIKELLYSSEHGNELTVRKLTCKETPEYLLIHLLLMNISNFEHMFKEPTFNNLTGQLYYFNPKMFEHYSKKQGDGIKQIHAFKIGVSKELLLTADETTFTNCRSKDFLKFDKKPYESYAKYAYDDETWTMQRATVEEYNLFIRKQFEDTKYGKAKFISIDSVTELEQTKAAALSNVTSKYNYIYEGLSSISFVEEEKDCMVEDGKKDLAYVWTKSLVPREKFRIIDAVQEKDSKELSERTFSVLKEIYNADVSITDVPEKDALNFRIVHNEDYYTKNKDFEDLHSDTFPGIAVQHLTLEDFDLTDSQIQEEIEKKEKRGKKKTDVHFAQVETLIKECIIKKDIINRKLSLYNWDSIQPEGDYTFAITTQENKDKKLYKYTSMTIHPNGSFYFDSASSIEFGGAAFMIKNGSLKKLAVAMERELTSFGNDKLRGAIYSPDGQINLIRETDWITLPKTEEILDTLKSTGKKLSRGKETRKALMDSILDIKYFTNDELSLGYYFSGTVGYGMKCSINNACHIREIKPAEGSSLFFEKLLPLLNVLFVKYGELTILPFPFKYIREYEKMLPLQ